MAPRSATGADPSQDRAADLAPVDPSPTASELPGDGVLAVLVQAAVILVGLTAARAASGGPCARLARRSPEPARARRRRSTGRNRRRRDGRRRRRRARPRCAAGPVDEVIVACWVRLEEAAAAAGVARGVGGDVGRAGQPGARPTSTPRPGRRRAARALPPGPLLAPPARRGRPGRRHPRAAGRSGRRSPERRREPIRPSGRGRRSPLAARRRRHAGRSSPPAGRPASSTCWPSRVVGAVVVVAVRRLLDVGRRAGLAIAGPAAAGARRRPIPA